MLSTPTPDRLGVEEKVRMGVGIKGLDLSAVTRHRVSVDRTREEQRLATRTYFDLTVGEHQRCCCRLAQSGHSVFVHHSCLAAPASF